MANNIFESFLARHRPEIINRFDKQTHETLPKLLSAEEMATITTQLVDLYIGRMLSTIQIEDPLLQSVVSGALAAKVPYEIRLENRHAFFAILQDICANDNTLSQFDREHIERVLDQSHKFSIVDLAIVKTQNLKSHQS